MNHTKVLGFCIERGGNAMNTSIIASNYKCNECELIHLLNELITDKCKRLATSYSYKNL